MVNEEKPKVEDGAVSKGRRFQQSTETWKATFKAPTSGLEYNVFEFGRQRHAADFAKYCGVVSKFATVNYKHGGPKIPWPLIRRRSQELPCPKSQKTQPAE